MTPVTEIVPSLVGLNLREAAMILSRSDIDIKVSGSGVVINQYPEAGIKITPGMICNLICQSGN